MSTSETIADAVIICAKNSQILKNKLTEIARNSEDRDERVVAGKIKEWILGQLEKYEVQCTDFFLVENPSIEAEQIQLLLGTFLRSAIQSMSDAGWNKIAKKFLEFI